MRRSAGYLSACGHAQAGTGSTLRAESKVSKGENQDSDAPLFALYMGLGVQGLRFGNPGWGPGLYPPEVWQVDLPKTEVLENLFYYFRVSYEGNYTHPALAFGTR
jgi:hypothetical protein